MTAPATTIIEAYLPVVSLEYNAAYPYPVPGPLTTLYQLQGLFKSTILWCIDPLIGKDLETSEYSRCYAVNEQKIPFLSNGSGNKFQRK
jgi:hypothetical protein